MTKKGKVLITGAGGFIGSHLVELFVKNGFEVKAFTHYNSSGKNGWLDTISHRARFEIQRGDIRDFDSVFSAAKDCSSIVHLAALIGIPHSYVSPSAYIKTNIVGTYNILETARMQDVGNVVITSTSETYGSAQYVPIDEIHPLVGQSPYSATKIGADQLGISYHRSFDVPVKIVRPFNTYGPRQSTRAVIPNIITQILSGKKIIELGDISTTRDFTYVKDTAKGFFEVWNSRKAVGEIFNVGTNSEISIENLVYLIANILDKKIKIKSNATRIRPTKSEVERLWCNNAKILEKTLWRPQYSLERGLKETVIWFQKNLSLYDNGEYSV